MFCYLQDMGTVDCAVDEIPLLRPVPLGSLPNPSIRSMWKKSKSPLAFSSANCFFEYVTSTKKCLHLGFEAHSKSSGVRTAAMIEPTNILRGVDNHGDTAFR